MSPFDGEFGIKNFRIPLEAQGRNGPFICGSLKEHEIKIHGARLGDIFGQAVPKKLKNVTLTLGGQKIIMEDVDVDTTEILVADNPRHAHLAKHAKKWRARKKNRKKCRTLYSHTLRCRADMLAVDGRVMRERVETIWE